MCVCVRVGARECMCMCAHACGSERMPAHVNSSIIIIPQPPANLKPAVAVVVDRARGHRREDRLVRKRRSANAEEFVSRGRQDSSTWRYNPGDPDHPTSTEDKITSEI